MPSPNFTVEPGPPLKGARSSLLQTTGVVPYPFGLLSCSVEGADNKASILSAMKHDRTVAVFPECPENAAFDSCPGMSFPELFVWDRKKRTVNGVLMRVLQRVDMPDGTMRAVLRGLKRIRFNSAYKEFSGGVAVDYSPLPDEDLMTPKDGAACIRALSREVMELSALLPGFPEELPMAVLNAPDPSRAADVVADAMNFSYEEKIFLLSCPSVKIRAAVLTILINRELETTRTGAKIQNEVHEAMGESQREYYLREQLKAI